ncbi:hypothetical protein R3L02_42995 [Streptomyces scabiei]|uniref:hypothetical protein n=1 Tax=Streptomyces scabiei TaxID=1930 RepID=UPI00298F2041|nr:hypothetical protein [Streptomyces scabiei]MDW8478516.1 hypothetical protein [Streptomyces scabiei]
MTDIEVTPKPETPAAVASAVLSAIEAQPNVFNMDHWAYLPEALRLPPRRLRHAVPNCARPDGRRTLPDGRS